jgi:hypothetical protein
LISDKRIDLNVYKDGSDLLNEEEIKSGDENSDIKAESSDIKQSSCCGSSNACNLKENWNVDEQQRSKAVSDINFNEWVGQSSTKCSPTD